MKIQFLVLTYFTFYSVALPGVGDGTKKAALKLFTDRNIIVNEAAFETTAVAPEGSLTALLRVSLCYDTRNSEDNTIAKYITDHSTAYLKQMPTDVHTVHQIKISLCDAGCHNMEYLTIEICYTKQEIIGF